MTAIQIPEHQQIGIMSWYYQLTQSSCKYSITILLVKQVLINQSLVIIVKCLYISFPTIFSSSSSFSGPLSLTSLLHLLQVLHVWSPCCLIRSWLWPTSETHVEFFAIKTAMPFLYHMTTNLTSLKNARGSRRLVSKLLQSGPEHFLLAPNKSYPQS